MKIHLYLWHKAFEARWGWAWNDWVTNYTRVEKIPNITYVGSDGASSGANDVYNKTMSFKVFDLD